MMVRRTLEGAPKCALRDFLREECSAVVEQELASISLSFSYNQGNHTGVDFRHGEGLSKRGVMSNVEVVLSHIKYSWALCASIGAIRLPD